MPPPYLYFYYSIWQEKNQDGILKLSPDGGEMRQGGDFMNEEKYKKVVDALVGFVTRVANGETTAEKEIEVLPAIASLLFNELFCR